MNLFEIETPAALVDHARMIANIARMQMHLNSLGVKFRPHVKTSKSLPVARAQRDAGASGITVSTLKEAEQFFDGGFTDILYAVCIAPNKIEHALALMARGCQLQLLVDSVEAASALALRARTSGVRFQVLIEIDTDGHRSGVKPEDDRLLEIARTLRDGSCDLVGVITHAGSSYDCTTPEALRAMANQERDLCVRAAQRLRAAGFASPVVSVGSTPTALAATDLTGVTEVRAGVYVFFDLVMAGVGICTTNEIALSVLTTVIGHQADKGWLIVDAGWMAMSRDRGTEKQVTDFGYGMVCDVEGSPIDGLQFSSANQEHGIISIGDAVNAQARFPIGTLLRILPNHACATGAQFPEYHVLRESGIEVWPRFYGW